jgi:hypothetical protein
MEGYAYKFPGRCATHDNNSRLGVHQRARKRNNRPERPRKFTVTVIYTHSNPVMRYKERVVGAKGEAKHGFELPRA